MVVVVGGNTTHVCMANIEDNVLNYIIFHICTEFVVSNCNALNSHGFIKKNFTSISGHFLILYLAHALDPFASFEPLFKI